MKFKFYSWLLAVLTVVAFTSNASAAICNYSVAACKVDSSTLTTGSTTGCKTYGQKAFNGQCIIDCATCSSGYTKVAKTYTDPSGCTISYYSCVLDAPSGVACATTEYGILPSNASSISKNSPNCFIGSSKYRCTSSLDCVVDCSSCSGGYELATKTVTVSSGCTMTYKDCVEGAGSDTECETDSDCGMVGSWTIAVAGKQSRTVPSCFSGSCTTNTEYRCVAGYYGKFVKRLLVCTECSEGYYSSEAGAMSCTACPDGSFTNATIAASSCTSCVTATGNEAATSVAPAITSKSCFLPTGTQMSSDETGTKKLIENCYYESDGSSFEVGDIIKQ